MPSSRSDLQLFDAGPIPFALASVKVELLHGKFSYDIKVADLTHPALGELDGVFAANDERLTLIYGNNGTGKTSLLRLLFNALSSAPDKGHRTAVHRTRFRSLEVHLFDGTLIAYRRSSDDLSGRFRAEIQRRGMPAVAWDYIPDEERFYLESNVSSYVVRDTNLILTAGGRVTDNGEAAFLASLSELELNPVFLADSRAITADILPEDDSALRRRRQRFDRDATEAPIAIRRVIDVTEAIDRARQYLSQLAISGTQAGSQRVDNVYLTVTGAVVQHAAEGDVPSPGLLPALRARINELGERSRRFHRYGLLPEFPAVELIDRLEDATDVNGPLLEHVLGPYLDGLEQRMDALDAGLRAVASYIDALNSFLQNKRVEYHLAPSRIVILDEETNEVMSPEELSSGEKQIVLLFSDVVALQGQTRLFIIDEPELSLNPDWQRKLMPALLELTAGSDMQFLAATHSIEIMARYRDRLRALDGKATVDGP